MFQLTREERHEVITICDDLTPLRERAGMSFPPSPEGEGRDVVSPFPP
jgi:hypothetical protein